MGHLPMIEEESEEENESSLVLVRREGEALSDYESCDENSSDGDSLEDQECPESLEGEKIGS